MGCRKLSYYQVPELPELKAVSPKTALTLINTTQKARRSYVYGWQNQERVDEIAGSGNHYTATYWEYDSRLGRRWNLDPVYKHYISNYSVLGNNPILMIDPNGADWYISNGEGASDEPVWLPNDGEATGLYGEGSFINLGENLMQEVVITADGKGNGAGKSYNAPDYLINAKGEHGVTETPGAGNTPRILEYHATTLNGVGCNAL